MQAIVTNKDIEEAAGRLQTVVTQTPLQFCKRLSSKFGAKIYLKREDLQEVRSFKIRGAYNKISSLSMDEKKRGVVCASAGNHAQGVAFACSMMQIAGVIFMPALTPLQKIQKVKHFGEAFVDVRLVGNTYDEASAAAHEYSEKQNHVYVHPFDDPLTIAGQGTVGKEIYEELGDSVDFVFVPIGGGGLIGGISTYMKTRNPSVSIIGAEPLGASGMYESLKKGQVVTLKSIDTFVDGAAVQKVGNLTFAICQKNVSKIIVVPEGKDCESIIDLYQNEGIIAEPAGALSVSALDSVASEIKNKTVVCVLSGGNNDLLRYPEILERSLVYQGRKHYFIIEFAQKPGQLRAFVDKALGPTDDIVLFEYMKKTNKEKGPALLGIELQDKKDLQPFLNRMKAIDLKFRRLDNKDLLYEYLI